MPLQRGQKLKLSDLTNATQIQVGLAIKAPSGMTFDISCFGVDAQGKLSDDRYFIFYNQKNSPCGALCSLGAQQGDMEKFRIDLSKLPPSIHKLVFTVTIDGNGTMSAIQNGYLRILENNAELTRFSFEGTNFSAEKAIIVGEFYRKDIWRFAAVGQGFNGGLSALLAHFGGEESTSSHPTDTSQTSKIAAQSAELLSNVGKGLSKGISSLVTRLTEKNPPTTIESSSSARRVSLEKRVEKEAPQLVNLVKSLTVSLEKNKLQDVVARVVLILDASGSMSRQYECGDLQLVVDRIIPLALHFDDDGELDAWAFAEKQKKLSPVTLRNVKGYVQQEWGGWSSWMHNLNASINNEPVVMRDVIKTFKNSDLPVYVIFISDGGVGYNSEIEKLLVESSHYPIFWQFVGLGGNSYGVLQRFDTMGGRKIDNCNFFALDDIKKIPDKELYDRLLNEFPQWLVEAKKVGILCR